MANYSGALSALRNRPPDAAAAMARQTPFLGKLCDDLYAAQAQMLLLGRKNAVERLACFLLSMSERNGEGNRLELLMTRGDIADHLGLTIETVSRTFSQLKGRAIIQLMASSDVVVRGRDELEEIAEAA
jgi:CRP/FNR family transcriptional regulator